jgi:hypothetical protein
MKPHVLLFILILMTVMASCVPQPAATQTPESQSDHPSLATKSAATEIAAPVIAASGDEDEMVATDPATFFVASGKLQLVEFFSFT